MTKWLNPKETHVPGALRSAIGGHPLVAETLVRRGFIDVEAAQAFLDPDRYEPAPPTELPNAIKAAERIEQAIRQGECICVWGDFDVDGQTATTTLVSTLRELGADVHYHIPNRKREGHGVNLPKLREIIAEGVSLILTCDTGVTAHEPVAYAQARGVDVVVTDHHDLPPALPDACAVIDPKMLSKAHPLRELPGVGVAYKLAELLYERAGYPAGAAQHLDLVALGIVADVATQTQDTRYLLQRGLEVLRHTQRLGLQVLMDVAELKPDRLTEEHIGFELAPRLNALGRLADATPAVEFLTTDDLERARVLAHELDGLNARRKMLCDQVTRGAEVQIERDPSLLEQGALVLSHPAWPAGVIGIVAGRLAEKYHRPTVLIAAPPGKLAQGSARSVPGCDISAGIAAQGEMLESFGGHPMAAGLSINPERISKFRRALSRTVRERCGDVLGEEPVLQIDSYVPVVDLSLDFVEELERLAPFGPGNPPLTLASRGLSLRSYTTVGRAGEHLQLIVEEDEGTAQKVIWWQGAGSPLPQGRFDLAYAVRASDYRGQRDVQVEWIDARERAPGPKRISTPRIQAVDYRREPTPQLLLERLRVQEDVLVWGEAGEKAVVAGRDRYELGPSRALVIWTTPPGPAELQAALELASPEIVYLFGLDPGLDQPEAFLKRLAGLIKRVLNAHQGRVEISTLAAATAQREATVWAGLAWLEARGHVVLLDQEGDEVHLAAGNGRGGRELSQAAARLKALLEETAAYRAHFARADAAALIPEL